MNIAEILIWESTNALLVIPVVIGIVTLTPWIRRRPAFTEHDWLFLFGHPREKVLSLHLWLRFAVLWVAVVLLGFGEGVRFGCAIAAVFTLYSITRLKEQSLSPQKLIDMSPQERIDNSGYACDTPFQNEGLRITATTMPTGIYPYVIQIS
jgi:hypothetical protein